MTDSRNILSTIVQSAVIDLFRGYDVAVAPIRPQAISIRSGGVYVAATIGYTSKPMSGALVLNVPEELLLIAAKQMMSTSFRLDDFTRELVNQLLGRLKNRLLSYKVDLHLGLPSIVAQAHGSVSHDEQQDTLEFAFRSLRGEVFVTLRGAIDYRALVYWSGSAGGTEGEVILF
jgi:hypothetical protein